MARRSRRYGRSRVINRMSRPMSRQPQSEFVRFRSYTDLTINFDPKVHASLMGSNVVTFDFIGVAEWNRGVAQIKQFTNYRYIGYDVYLRMTDSTAIITNTGDQPPDPGRATYSVQLYKTPARVRVVNDKYVNPGDFGSGDFAAQRIHHVPNVHTITRRGSKVIKYRFPWNKDCFGDTKTSSFLAQATPPVASGTSFVNEFSPWSGNSFGDSPNHTTLAPGTLIFCIDSYPDVPDDPPGTGVGYHSGHSQKVSMWMTVVWKFAAFGRYPSLP